MKKLESIYFLFVALTFGCAKSNDSQVASEKPPLEAQGLVLTEIINIEPANDCPDKGYTKTYRSIDGKKTFKSTTCYSYKRTSATLESSASLRLTDEPVDPFFSSEMPSSFKEYCDGYDKVKVPGKSKNYRWLGSYVTDPSVSNPAKGINRKTEGKGMNCYHDPAEINGLIIGEIPKDDPDPGVFDLRVISYMPNLKRIIVMSSSALNAQNFTLPSKLRYIDFILNTSSTAESFQKSLNDWSLAMQNIQYMTIGKKSKTASPVDLDYSFIKNMPEILFFNSIHKAKNLEPFESAKSLQILELNTEPTNTVKKLDFSHLKSFRYEFDQGSSSLDNKDKIKYTVDKFYYHK